MSRSCKECAHHNPDFIDEVCLHCSWPEFAGEPSNFKPKPITNADRIRSMTDEELAEWFYSGDLPWCNFEEDVVPCPYEEMPDPCEHCLINWLKEEVLE